MAKGMKTSSCVYEFVQYTVGNMCKGVVMKGEHSPASSFLPGWGLKPPGFNSVLRAGEGLFATG